MSGTDGLYIKYLSAIRQMTALCLNPTADAYSVGKQAEILADLAHEFDKRTT